MYFKRYLTAEFEFFSRSPPSSPEDFCEPPFLLPTPLNPNSQNPLTPPSKKKEKNPTHQKFNTIVKSTAKFEELRRSS